MLEVGGLDLSGDGDYYQVGLELEATAHCVV